MKKIFYTLFFVVNLIFIYCNCVFAEPVITIDNNRYNWGGNESSGWYVTDATLNNSRLSGPMWIKDGSDWYYIADQNVAIITNSSYDIEDDNGNIITYSFDNNGKATPVIEQNNNVNNGGGVINNSSSIIDNAIQPTKLFSEIDAINNSGDGRFGWVGLYMTAGNEDGGIFGYLGNIQYLTQQSQIDAFKEHVGEYTHYNLDSWEEWIKFLLEKYDITVFKPRDPSPFIERTKEAQARVQFATVIKTNQLFGMSTVIFRILGIVFLVFGFLIIVCGAIDELGIMEKMLLSRITFNRMGGRGEAPDITVPIIGLHIQSFRAYYVMVGGLFIVFGAILCTPSLYLGIIGAISDILKKLIEIFSKNENIDDFLNGNGDLFNRLGK